MGASLLALAKSIYYDTHALQRMATLQLWLQTTGKFSKDNVTTLLTSHTSLSNLLAELFFHLPDRIGVFEIDSASIV